MVIGIINKLVCGNSFLFIKACSNTEIEYNT